MKVMTYEESSKLMTDLTFRGRCKVAVLNYASKILNAPTPAAGGNAMLRWAQQTFQQPDQAAGQVQPPAVMHPAVQEYGNNIEDSTLQFAVEQTVDKMT